MLLNQVASWAQETTLLPLQPHKISYARQVEREALAAKDSNKLAEAYYLYGKTYEAAGAWETSIQYFFKSLKILERKGDSFELGRLYLRIGGNNYLQHRYKAHLQSLRQALAVFKRIKSETGLFRTYGGLSYYYAKDWTEGGKYPEAPRPNLDSALYYSQIVQRLVVKRNIPIEIAESKREIARLYRKRNAKLALSYVHEALNLYQSHHKYGDAVNAFIELAALYIDLGQTTHAAKLLQRAEILATEKNLFVFGIQLQLESEKVHLYNKLKNWQLASAHSERLRQLEHQQFKANQEGALSRLIIEYETEKKEAQLKQQQQEITLRNESLKNQQRFLLAMGTLLALTAGMSIVFFRLYRKNQRISQRNAELVKEQNHRVKNNLQVVSSLLSLQSNRLADETAQKAVEESQLRVETMAILHRRLYDGDGLVVVNLADFVSELVEGVLQTFGYGHLAPAFDLAAINISADQALPIGLIINELTTNACKYAFPDNPEPLFKVSATKTQQHLELTVTDNGLGFRQKSIPDVAKNPPKSFGLRLIHMQVEQLRGVYHFERTSTQGFIFTMSCNL